MIMGPITSLVSLFHGVTYPADEKEQKKKRAKEEEEEEGGDMEN